MTSTTDELRQMLDERGIEWKADDTDVLLHTVWHNENGQLVTHFEPIGDDCGGFTSEVSLYDCTPEQAIAATLGNGECRITASSTDGLTSVEPRHWFRLSCGHSFTVDGLDAPVACPVCGKAVER